MERDFSITPLLINHQAHPGKNNWVKIFIYEPAEVEVKQARGTMYAVLSLSAKNTFDFTPLMQTILEELHTQYFQQTTGSILQTLERTLDNIHKKLILIGQEDKRLSESFEFNLLTAVSWGTVLYFGQLGPSRAALLRDGKLFDIDEGEQKSTNLYLSSGVLQTHDMVILGTNQFFKRFTRTNLKKILSLPQQKIVAELEDNLDPGPDRQNQSAIVLSVDIKQVPSPQEEGLKILDSSGLGSKPVGAVHATPARHRLPDWKSVSEHSLGSIKHLFKWKVGGFIPVVPLLLVILAIAALLYSIYGGKEWQPTFGPNQAIISSATDKISQAEVVADVNPDRALDLLGEAEKYITQGLAEYPQNQDLRSLQSKLEELEQKILIITVVSTTEVATLHINPAQAKLINFEDDIYVIDTQKQDLLRITSNGKLQPIASDFKFAEGALLAISDNGLAVTSRAQVIPVDFNGSMGDVKSLTDTAQPVAMTGFSQNTYILDAAGQIYRAPVEENSIGNISNYFIRPIGGTALVDVAVDGSVYLLHQEGEVEVYLNGEKQPFTLERGILAKEGRAIFASQESESLYVLQDSALIIWDKKGKYHGQVRFKNGAAWQMAGVDLEHNILYALVDDSLVKANLPELN